MTAPAHPGRTLYITLPVADVERSRAFYQAIGFGFDPTFGDEASACMSLGEHVVVMLGTRERVAELSKLPLADPRAHALALFCFTAATREEVDTVAEAALAAGGRDADDDEDHGFMRSRAFYDLDGHGWQVMWMDPAAVAAATGEPAEGGADAG